MEQDNRHHPSAHPADAPWTRQYSHHQVVELYAQALAGAERERDQMQQALDISNGLVWLLLAGHEAALHYGIDFMAHPSFMSSCKPFSRRHSNPAAVKRWIEQQRRQIRAAVREIDRKIDREIDEMVRLKFGRRPRLVEAPPDTPAGDTFADRIDAALARFEAPKAAARCRRRKRPPQPLRLVWSNPSPSTSPPPPEWE